MNAYLITWDESDGNDCTVYETIVVASSEDDATEKLATAIEKTLDENGTEYESDGNVLGYYFGCSDDCPEDDHDGHGGIGLRDVETFETEDQAREHMSKWHSEWSIEAA